MAARALKVLLVNQQRQALRHCARLLSAFGYEVSSLSSIEQTKESVEADRPDILVLSGASGFEEALSLCRAVDAATSDGYTYKLLQVGEPQPADILRAVESGVDDFLNTPLEDGELLARLRMAARVIEYERRAGRPPARTGSDNLLTPQNFLAYAQSEIRRLKTGESLACVVVQLDNHRQLRNVHGQATVTRAIAEIVRRINEIAAPAMRVGRLDNDRLAVLTHAGASGASEWAERLRGAVEAGAATAGEARPAYTVSCGFSLSDDARSQAADLLFEARQSAELARQSGGNYVASHSEYVEEDSRWTEIAANGKVFENTIARNIMVPSTLLLRASDPISQVNAWLKQTQLRALPVVDDEGKLAGLVSDEELQGLPAAAQRQPVSTVMIKEVVSFDERTTLAALIDYFAQESPLVIVIANKGRPTGLVTPNSLATLIEKLTNETFAAGAEGAGNSNLIVPNLCGVDG
jgi:GGDEF domain-containing protein/predicted transcriptional regulator